MFSSQNTCVFYQDKKMRLPAKTEMSSSQDTCLLARTHVSPSQGGNVFQSGTNNLCLLAWTEKFSNQDNGVLQPGYTCLLAEHYGKRNTKTQNATFQRFMTNVPGIVPQPYPIVNYPGTFAIILRKVATPFPFFKGVLIANPLIFRNIFWL